MGDNFSQATHTDSKREAFAFLTQDLDSRQRSLIYPIRLRCAWSDGALSSPVGATGEDDRGMLHFIIGFIASFFWCRRAIEH